MDRIAAGLMLDPLASADSLIHRANASPVGAAKSSTSQTGRSKRSSGLLADNWPSINTNTVVSGMLGMASASTLHSLLAW